MALGNGSAANGGVTQEKAPMVNGTNMETLPRAGNKVKKIVYRTDVRRRATSRRSPGICIIGIVQVEHLRRFFFVTWLVCF